MNSVSIKTRGFTLIESIIYIGIFSFIMAGTLVAIYSIMSSSSRNQTKAMITEEGSFLINKINWTLGNIKTISVSTDGHTITVEKYDQLDNPFVLSVAGNDMTLQRGSKGKLPLNNSNVTVSCPTSGCFTDMKEVDQGTVQDNILSKITLTSHTSDGASFAEDFTTIKFINK